VSTNSVRRRVEVAALIQIRSETPADHEPVCVPTHQRCGVGSALIRSGRVHCAELGWKAVFLVGNPEFHSRFGFALAAPRGLRYESESFDPVFQVLELERGALQGRQGWVRSQEAFARTA
jgi:putative acetyltransferase